MMTSVSAPARGRLTSSRNARILLGLQLVLTLALLALVPGGWAKLLGFLICWLLTFGAIRRRELFIYISVSALFSLMDIMAVRQGVFRFYAPDFLGLPVWEFFMWGFYVFHCMRLLGGAVPRVSRFAVVALAVLFAIPFMTLTDSWMLLAASGAVLAIALAFFHERADLVYVGYMIIVGALIEYVGVWSGQWRYPGDPIGGVPLWFISMWGGIGLFTRRLIVPLLHANSSQAIGHE